MHKYNVLAGSRHVQEEYNMDVCTRVLCINMNESKYLHTWVYVGETLVDEGALHF